MILRSAAALEALGATIAPLLRRSDIITLEGPLGVGKTTLMRGLMRALGHDGDVASPTFAIVNSYEAPPLRIAVAHADLYRVENAYEIEELGLDEALAVGVLAVEWPDKLPSAMKRYALAAMLEFDGNDARRLTMTAGTAWTERWPPT